MLIHFFESHLDIVFDEMNEKQTDQSAERGNPHVRGDNRP